MSDDRLQADHGHLSSEGTVTRVMRLLGTLSESTSPRSISEIATITCLPRSTVHRLLHLLANEGAVIYDQERRNYRPGARLLNLAYSLVDRNSVEMIIGRCVHNLSELTGESSAFVIFNRAHNTFIFAQNVCSKFPMGYSVERVRQLPAHTGSTCLSVLAHLPEERAINIARSSDLFLSRDSRLKSANALAELFDYIRTQGVCISYGPVIDGAMGVSAPVFDKDDNVVGSLCVHRPVSRDDHDRRKWLSSTVKRFAGRLSARFAYQ